MNSTSELRSDSPIDRGSLNLPNVITFVRLILSLVLLVLIDWGGLWITCTVIFVIGVTTDVIDGYLARKWNQITVLGRIMDPFVDKIIIGGTLIFLTPYPESGVFPWLTFTVIGREMFITGLRSVLEGHGVDFSAKWSGKLKMFIQSVTIPFCLMSLSSDFSDFLGDSEIGFLLVRDVLLWGTLIVTLYSGLEYTWRGYLLMTRQRRDSR